MGNYASSSGGSGGMNKWNLAALMISIFAFILSVVVTVLVIIYRVDDKTIEGAITTTPSPITTTTPSPITTTTPSPITTTAFSKRTHTIMAADMAPEAFSSNVSHVIPNITSHTDVFNLQVYTQGLRRKLNFTHDVSRNSVTDFQIGTYFIPDSTIDTNIFIDQLSDVSIVNDKLVLMDLETTGFFPSFFYKLKLYTFRSTEPAAGFGGVDVVSISVPSNFVNTFSNTMTQTSSGVPIVAYKRPAVDALTVAMVIIVGSGPGDITGGTTITIDTDYGAAIFGESFTITGEFPVLLTTQWLRDGVETLTIVYYSSNQMFDFMYTNSDFSNPSIVGGLFDQSDLKPADISTQSIQFTTSPDRQSGIFAGVNTNDYITIYYVDNTEFYTSFLLIPGPQVASGITGLHILNQRLVLVACNATATLPGVYAYVSGNYDLDLEAPITDWTKTTVVDGVVDGNLFLSVATIVHNNQVWVCYRSESAGTDLFLAVGSPVGNPMTTLIWSTSILQNLSVSSTLWSLPSTNAENATDGLRFFMNEVGDDVVLVYGIDNESTKIVYLTNSTGNPNVIVEWLSLDV
jgi:hypothetical protein